MAWSQAYAAKTSQLHHISINIHQPTPQQGNLSTNKLPNKPFSPEIIFLHPFSGVCSMRNDSLSFYVLWINTASACNDGVSAPVMHPYWTSGKNYDGHGKKYASSFYCFTASFPPSCGTRIRKPQHRTRHLYLDRWLSVVNSYGRRHAVTSLIWTTQEAVRWNPRRPSGRLLVAFVHSGERCWKTRKFCAFYRGGHQSAGQRARLSSCVEKGQ